MKLIRKISMVAATFVLAAATGQYMQSGTAAPQATAAKPLPTTPASKTGSGIKIEPLAATAVGPAISLPAMPKFLASPPPALRAPAPGERHAAADAPVGPLPRSISTPAPLNAVCGPKAALSVGDGAMLDLSLSAPCHAGERVVIRHAGLAFTALTDAKGGLRIRLPAMAEAAEVSVLFAGGTSVAAQTNVPELSLYDRVAVQWMGDDAFDLHGLEFGAAFGAAGDVSASNPGAVVGASAATGGFLTALGDGSVDLPMRAQVYTFPTRLSARDGDVQIVIEAEITPKTCGRDMLAQTVGTRRNADPAVTDLSVSMPDCGTPGGYVELSGLIPDIRVAGN